MIGQLFVNRGQKFRIAEIMEHQGMIREMGWTHFAAVTRPNGRKQYYANLLIADGEIVNSVVVL
jgi:hypothetical protein